MIEGYLRFWGGSPSSCRFEILGEIIHAEKLSTISYAAMKEKRLFVSWLFQKNGGEERWDVHLDFRCIPSITYVCSGRMTPSLYLPREKGLEFLRFLYSEKLVDTYFIRPMASEEGCPVSLYLENKIRVLEYEERRRLFNLPSQQISVCRRIELEAAKVLGCNDRIKCRVQLAYNRRAINKFFLECDEKLLNSLGENLFEEVLQPLGVSLRQWLAARFHWTWLIFP
jgi:hypothetical protein